jgi:ribosome recycling factor
MSAQFDLADIKRRMQGSIASLKHELNGLRTGRASATLLDPIMVNAYGSMVPLSQVASVTVPEARMIAVNVWDKGTVAAVDKAIRDSNLGLSPNVEGQVLRVRIPELNEQRRKELVKVAHKYAEDCNFNEEVAKYSLYELKTCRLPVYPEVILARFEDKVLNICKEETERLMEENKAARREGFVRVFLTRPCRICGSEDHHMLREEQQEDGTITKHIDSLGKPGKGRSVTPTLEE